MTKLLSSLWFVCATAFIAIAAPPPHILYIVADDLGWKDVGFHGGADIQTPNLDRLAATGTRLEQFYVQPFCTPSRAALMTGRYPYRYGLQTIVIPSKGTYGLATDEVTMPQVLKEAGYATVMIGKWHLGHADQKYWPRQRGFDYHYGAVLGEIDYFTHSAHDVLDWQRNNRTVKEQGYVTQLLGKDAVKQIRAHDGKQPMFLYLAFTAPHTPYQAPPEYVQRFQHIADETRRTYVAMVACLDDEIGKVLAALEEKQMRANTLIVFHSDNGGTRDARFTGEGNVKKVPCDNGPLRAGLLPTLAKVAGASTAKCKPLDGRDVWSTFTHGKPSGRTEIVYNLEPYRGAVRQGDWKLVWTALLPPKVELFNLAKDPNETTDLAEQEPAKVKALQARLVELSREAVKPLFFETAAEAVFSGIFGPAPIPTEDGGATGEP